MTIGSLRQLFALSEGERVTEGKVKPYMKQLKPLFDEKIIGLKNVSKTRNILVLKSKERLDVYMLKHYGIKNIKGYIEVSQKSDKTRTDVLGESTDDKSIKTNPQTGLFLKANVNILYNDKELPLSLIMNDGIVFHLDTPGYLPFPDREVTIVGVENYETLAKIKSQIEIFGEGKFLFIFINSFMLQWIKGLQNDYIHYGDFDYAGISIYKDKVVPKLRGKHSFYIPDNIEALMDKSDSKNYFKQVDSYKKENLKGVSAYLDKLIELIYDRKITVQQELIVSNL